jgi:tRNA uridine 5-carboxymethylaminomethyl modification enzyme
MFTSRAEFRLSFREDNADMRLTEIGRKLGCVGDVQWQLFEEKREQIALELARLKSTWVNPNVISIINAERVLGKQIEREYSLFDLLRRPEVSYAGLKTLIEGQPETAAEVSDQVEIQVKYHGYIERQQTEIDRQLNNEAYELPSDIDYSTVVG